MISYRDLLNGLRCLDIEQKPPVIVHASLSSFGEVRGGAETILGALLTGVGKIMMPAFTYKTMLVPEEGPEENGVSYGSGKDLNRMAEFFAPSMPADPMMGVIAEKLRQMPGARRSNHPILSFVGIDVDDALNAQTIEEPLAPIGKLAADGGWVLLVGVDHTVNTSIHYAEHLAGRKQFLRWAITPKGAVACHGFPGCSDGFGEIEPHVNQITRSVKVGNAKIQAIPLSGLIDTAQRILAEDPLALLCKRNDCERCSAVRKSVRAMNN